MFTILAIYLILYAFTNIPACYLHRDLAHSNVKFSTMLASIARIMLWMRTNKYNSQNSLRIWVAIHVKHHIHSDTVLDPHSPWHRSFWTVVNNRREFLADSEIQQLTKNINLSPLWVDKYLDKYPVGQYVLLVILLLAFSWVGLICWVLVQQTIKLENLFNVVAHKFPGYTNSKSLKQDRARNIFPLWLLVYGGEELHGNHHTFPNRANLAIKWWEFDIMYCLLKILSLVGLVDVNKKLTKV